MGRSATIGAAVLMLSAMLAGCSRSGGTRTVPRQVPVLDLRAPSDGELWLERAPALVSWRARGLDGVEVLVEVSRDDGVTWEAEAAASADDDKDAFAWVSAGDRGERRVRVRASDGSVSSVEHRVDVVSAMVEVAIGGSLAFCLRADGTVRMWGRTPERFYEVYGEEPPLPVPQPLIKVPTVFPGLDRIRSIAPMGPNCHQLLAVTEDNRVIQWGDYLRPLPPLLEPTEVAGLSDVLFCRAGGSISFARLEDGRVYGWGRNQAGTLGDGTDEVRTEPTLIPALEGVVDIAVGWIHCLALKPDGTVLSWGQNAHGTLGDGSFGLFYRMSPQPVPGITDAVAVLAGFDHSAVLLADGTVWTWGDNSAGQLGRETVTWFDPYPGLVGRLPLDVVAIDGRNDDGFALTSTGVLYSWGSNGRGQLGTGLAYAGIELPAPATVVPPLSRLFAGAASAPHAIASDGTWIAWGANIFFAVGDGSGIDQYMPVPIVAR